MSMHTAIRADCRKQLEAERQDAFEWRRSEYLAQLARQAAEWTRRYPDWGTNHDPETCSACNANTPA